MSDSSELEEIAARHHQNRGFTPRLIECRFHTLDAFLPGGTILDLGCADGLLTRRLAQRSRRVVAVDASAIRVERTRAAVMGLASVEVKQARFEDLDPGERFHGIVLSCILEHLEDPVALLQRIRPWLLPSGRVVAIVPNAGSLHRRAGVLMGMLRSLDDSGEADHDLGHHTMYTIPRLAADFEQAGYRVVARGGHLIKPLPNDGMAAFDPELLSAFEELGRQFPDLAAEIFVAGESA